MRIGKYKLLMTAGACFCVGSAYAAPQYTLTDLGNFNARGINASGVVVGSAFHGGNSHAVIYNGVLLDLGTLSGGGTSSFGQAINDAGIVVGAAYGANGISHAFMYDGVLHDLGTLGGSYSSANGINNNGVIVGSSYTNGTTNSHAFLYDGTMHDLGTLGGQVSTAFSINDSGLVVGSATRAGGASAFLYDGTMHDLGTMGGWGATATSINNAGVVVGSSDMSFDNDSFHAFIYNGTLQDITPFGPSSTATDINAAGVAVGSYAYDPGTNYYRAFVYDGLTTIDLNSLIVGGLSGFYLSTAEGINDAGQIVANGTNGHAYLLSPVPIPAAAWLFGSVVGMLAARVRWRVDIGFN